MADAYQLFRLSLVEQRQPDFFPTAALTRSNLLRKIFNDEILFRHYGSDFHYKPAEDKGSYVVGRIGRKIQAVENLPPEEGFDERLHDGWLASVVLIQPEDKGNGQKLSMQTMNQIGTVFPILKSLVAHINSMFANELYFLEIQPIFDAATFWKFADDHRGNVTSITFDFVMPNGLWSSASTLREELAQANKSTNAQELSTTLKSQAGLITDSPAVKEAVEYAEKGSGAIAAKSREGHRYSSKSKIKKVSLMKDIGHVLKSHLAVVCILTACKPDMLGDANEFLKGFVSHEFLGFMGVIVTISLASAANVALELNKYEERAKETLFSHTRENLKTSAFWLLATLPLALAEAVIKSIGPIANPRWQSASNGFALITIIFSFLILADLTSASFELKPPRSELRR